MKKSKLLLVGMVTIAAMLVNAPAKAATTSQTTTQSTSLWDGLSGWLSGLFGGSGNGSTSGSSSSTSTTGGSATSGGGTALPVNGGLWMLVAAGAVVGCTVITRKKREITAQQA